jgi:hypothetical protein
MTSKTVFRDAKRADGSTCTHNQNFLPGLDSSLLELSGNRLQALDRLTNAIRRGGSGVP